MTERGERREEEYRERGKENGEAWLSRACLSRLALTGSFLPLASMLISPCPRALHSNSTTGNGHVSRRSTLTHVPCFAIGTPTSWGGSCPHQWGSGSDEPQGPVT